MILKMMLDWRLGLVGSTERAIVEAIGRVGQVTCRCTHVYPDGPGPYSTFHAVGRHGELSAQ
jgi:alkyldihydroxyacetonephosphate synthase